MPIFTTHDDIQQSVGERSHLTFAVLSLTERMLFCSCPVLGPVQLPTVCPTERISYRRLRTKNHGVSEGINNEP